MADKDEDSDGFDIDPEILARAEQAVAALSESFVAAAREDLATMRGLVDTLAAGPDPGSVDALYGRAHDMAGQGGSFGFPLLSRLGRSLCDLIQARNRAIAAGDIALLRAHLDAAQAILDDPDTADAEGRVAEIEARGRA